MANKRRHGWLKHVRENNYSIKRLLHWQQDFYAKIRPDRCNIFSYIAEQTEFIGLQCTPVLPSIGGHFSVVNYYGQVIIESYMIPEHLSLDWRVALRRRVLRENSPQLTLAEARNVLTPVFSPSMIVGFDVFNAMARIGFLNRFLAIDVRRLPIFGCVASTTEQSLMWFFYNIEVVRDDESYVTNSAAAAMVLFRTFEPEYRKFFVPERNEKKHLDIFISDSEEEQLDDVD